MKTCIYLIYILIIMLHVAACKKKLPLICLTCNTPLINYHLASPTDTVNYVYNINGDIDLLQIQYLQHQGYTLTIDTLWTALINYNECYSQSDYNNIIYPRNSRFYDTFCVKQ